MLLGGIYGKCGMQTVSPAMNRHGNSPVHRPEKATHHHLFVLDMGDIYPLHMYLSTWLLTRCAVQEPQKAVTEIWLSNKSTMVQMNSVFSRHRIHLQMNTSATSESYLESRVPCVLASLPFHGSQDVEVFDLDQNHRRSTPVRGASLDPSPILGTSCPHLCQARNLPVPHSASAD